MATRTPRESESELLCVLDQLSSSRTLHCKPVPPLRVAVLTIQRYLSDERSTPDCYSYDVTITDGKCRVKCFLARGLNRSVQVNSVRCGSHALITHLSLVYDETRLRHGCVCIEEVRYDSSDPDVLLSIPDPDTIPWWTRDSVVSAAMTLTDVPLQYNRKHYLSLWNNEDPHGAVWVRNTPPPDVVIDVSKISLLGDLECFLASSRRPCPLLVRVLHRSRLRFYGKPGQNIDFPFQAYFEVADQSGVMSMVLWNDLCPEWYQRLVVGSVVYLQHFGLKRSYQHRSRPQLNTQPLFFFRSTEICLNPHSPSAVITVIPPKSVQSQWSLPEVSYSFYTRHEVESLATNQACDIIGLVTYVSRVERIRNRGNTVPEKFWTYRWVHAVDGTLDVPFILEIFASSQPEIFNNISPMTYLVCTQMRVCRQTGSDSGPGSALYLTSSTETQLFITGSHKKQPYVSEPKVKAFIQWTKSLKDNVVMRKTTIGGHFCYPPPPLTFTPNTTSNGASEGACPTLTAVGDLQRELQGLQYREHRRVAVQGHIAVVQYHRWPPEAPESTPLTEGQAEHDSVGVARGSTSSFSTGEQRHSATSSASSRSDALDSSKRRRVEPGGVQRQYWTRARWQLERQAKAVEIEDADTKSPPCDADSKIVSTPSPPPTGNSETGSTSDTRPSPNRPVASWESGIWSLLKHDITDHLLCSPLDRESVPETFRFDERDVLLHRINLSPARWSPDAPADADSDVHTVENFTWYLTLTLLGLNQQAAVDVLFLPVFSPKDPRSVGVSYGLHDNTLASCLSTGHPCAQDDFSADTLLRSASALEDERVVCVLDVCLLGENRLEIICSKVYTTADIITPV